MGRLVPDIRLADISEFQASVDADAYLKAGNECIINRVYNGYRADYKWPARGNALRGYDFTSIGWYAYLAHDVDAASQAHAFIACVGSLRDNEWPILDLEEGSGDQAGRAQAWFNVVDKWASFPGMLYSGESFLEERLGGADHWGSRPIWIAAYRDSEPTARHLLWQFSDAYYFTGIGNCDGNLAHCSSKDFIADVRPGKSTPERSAPEQEGPFVVVKDDGRIEAFVEKADGAVLHRWQTEVNDGWSDKWASLGKP